MRNNAIRDNIENLFVREHFPGVPKSIYPHGAGVRAELRFKNSFGASVIRSHYTYGGDKGLYELGILIYKGDQGALAFTPLNPDGDVFGYLDPEAVEKLLEKIILLQPCQGQLVELRLNELKELGNAFGKGLGGTDLDKKSGDR